MNYKNILIVIGLIGSGSLRAQDFTYSIAGDIGSADLFALEIKPFNLYIQGMYMGLGVGGRLLCADLGNKISLEGEGLVNLTNYSFDKNKLDFSTDPTRKTGLTFAGDVKFGYMLKQNRESVTETVRLKGTNRFQTVSNLPVDAIFTYSVTIGYSIRSLYTDGEAQTSFTYIDPYLGQEVTSTEISKLRYKQMNHNVIVGFKRRKSEQTVFKTNRFGTRTQSVENEIYGDVLVNLVSALPSFYDYAYQDPTYPNEISAATPASSEDAASIASSIKRLPVGLRVGLRNGSRNVHGVIWHAQLGLNPGRYSKIIGLVELQLGIAYRFIKEL